jgi:hypothetical protein
MWILVIILFLINPNILLASDNGQVYKNRVLKSVSYYTSGEASGCIIVNFDDNKPKMKVLGPGVIKKNWGFEINISKDDSAYLQDKIMILNLRSFIPEGSWFQYYVPNYSGEHKGCLDIKWDDYEVVYAIPQENVKANLPDGAKGKYKAIYSIVDRLRDMKMKNKKNKKNLVIIPKDDIAINDFVNELRRIFAISLPRESENW